MAALTPVVLLRNLAGRARVRRVGRTLVASLLMAGVFGLGLLMARVAAVRPVGGTLSPAGPDWVRDKTVIQALPARERTVTAEVDFVSGPQGIKEQATYEVQTKRGDPLLRLLRLGQVRPVAVATLYAGAPTWQTFKPAMIQTRGGGDTTITISSSYLGIPPRLCIPVREAGVRTRLTVRSRGVDVSGVDAPVEPYTQDRNSVAFRAEDGPGRVRIALAAAGSGCSDRSGAGLLSLGDNPGLWHVARAIPWIAVLIAATRSRNAVSYRFRIAGWAYLIAVPSLAAMLLYASGPTSASVLSVVFVVAPALAVWWLRSISEPPAPRQRRTGALVLAVASGVTAVAVLLVAGAPWATYGWLAGLTAGAGALGLLSTWVGRLPQTSAWLALAFLPGTVVTSFLAGQLVRTGDGLAYLAFGLLMGPLAVGTVNLIGPRRLLAWRIAAVLGTAVLAVPGGLLVDPQTVLRARPARDLVLELVLVGEIAVSVLDLALMTILLVTLARRGRQAQTLAEPFTRGSAIALSVMIAGPGYQTAAGPTLATIVLFVVLMWAIPPGRAERAVGLAEVSGREHARLVRQESWHRYRHRLVDAVYRSGPDKIASGDRKLAELRKAWAKLTTSAPRDSVQLTEQALGSAAGFELRQNAIAGAAAAALLASPMIAYEGWLSHAANSIAYADIPTALTVRYGFPVLRWAAYGAIFGYFYTQLRGTRPLPKACGLLLALALPESLAIITAPYSTQRTILFALAIRAGQMLVLAIGLGLFWERRLCNTAEIPWNKIRDFHTPSALAAPITALAVAATTAVATPFAGAAVTALLQSSTPTVPSAHP